MGVMRCLIDLNTYGIQWCDKHFYSALSFASEDDVLYEPIFTVLSPSYYDTLQSLLRQEEPADEIFVELLSDAGDLIPCMFYGELSDNNQYQCTFASVYQQRAAYSALEKSISGLKASYRTLQEYPDMFMHYIKKPLIRISYYAAEMQQLIDNINNQDLAEYNTIVLEQAALTENLLSSLLFYVNFVLEEFITEEFDLDKLVSSIISEFKQQYPAVSFHVESVLPIIIADKNKISMLFKQLFENAIIHNNQDVSITIGTRFIDQHYGFYVRDNGVGLDKNSGKKIFNIFNQAQHDNNNNINFGMGLALCKYIIESHHGKIFLNTKPQKGCEFLFYFSN